MTAAGPIKVQNRFSKLSLAPPVVYVYMREHRSVWRNECAYVCVHVCNFIRWYFLTYLCTLRVHYCHLFSISCFISYGFYRFAGLDSFIAISLKLTIDHFGVHVWV